MSAEPIDLEAAEAAAEDGKAFHVDLEGFEGPLHLLLQLARAEKVDLRRISILRLAEQYLAFVAEARAYRIELAADYLVMAAWLAYLKSRLLLPKAERATEEAPAEDLAEQLAWRLRRLEAMRAAGEALHARPILGEDTFARGAPEARTILRGDRWDVDLLDLLRAYATQRLKQAGRRMTVKPMPVYPIEEARRRIEDMLWQAREWRPLGAFAPETARFREPPSKASRYASLVSASLELAKAGKLDLQQLEAFGPLYLRQRDTDAHRIAAE